MDMPLLGITVLRSRRLAAAIVAIHAVAAACVVAYGGWGWAVAAVAVLAGSMASHWGRDVMLEAADAVGEIMLREDGCELHCRDGAILQGTVTPESFVSTWLICVVVRLDSGRRRTVTLLPDSATTESLRRLRVWLRFRLRPEPSGSVAA
jgi:hypothetical protein